MNANEAEVRARQQVKIARIDENAGGVVTTYWEVSNNHNVTRYEDEAVARSAYEVAFNAACNVYLQRGWNA